MPLTQRGRHLLLRGECSDFPQAQRLGNGRHDAGGIADRGERHEAGAIGEVGTQGLCDLQGQARFAHAPGAGNGQQAHLWMPQEIADCPHLLFATDQGREWHRETGKPWFRTSRFV